MPARASAHANALPAIIATIIGGMRGSQRRDISATTSVTAPVAVIQGSIVANDAARVRRLVKKPLPGGDRDAEEGVELRGHDQQRRAGGESDDDRVRDEVDEAPEAREPHRELDRADEHAKREHQRHVVGSAGRGERRDRGEHDERQRVGGAADEMPRRSPQRRDDRRDHRAIEAILRRQPGERRVGDALRQHDERADEPGLRVRAERRARRSGAARRGTAGSGRSGAALKGARRGREPG